MYLHDLAIAPEWRGKGLAETAIRYFDEQTRAMGFSKQFLASVQDSKGFWEKKGFNVVKEIFYAGKKSFLMYKELP